MSKTFLKQIKTHFGLNSHILTHNSWFGVDQNKHFFVKIMNLRESQQINIKLQRKTTFYVRIILFSKIYIIHKVKTLKHIILKFELFSNKKVFLKKLKKTFF